MGVIFSRFRRKQSTFEVLQQIEDEIATIEEYKTGARLRQQRLSTVIVAYSVVLYLVAGLLFYYHYFPDDVTTRLLCVGALLLSPAIVYLLKRSLMCYYGRKISKNEQKSTSLKKKKETILEEVQDKETYKVAKEILEKFAPEQLRRSPMRPSVTPATPAPQHRLAALRQRQLPSSGLAARTPVPATPLGALPPPPGSGRYARQVVQSPMPGVPGRTLQPQAVAPRAGPPLPRPVLPRERGIMDRMLDYLVGDGPANRYALICCQCQSHNGMALKEEFEYLAFRCSYCFAWNPARKQRPAAPRLPAAPNSGESMVESDTTETSESEPEEARAGGLPASEADDRPASRSGEPTSSREEPVLEQGGREDGGEDTAPDRPGEWTPGSVELAGERPELTEDAEEPVTRSGSEGVHPIPVVMQPGSTVMQPELTTVQPEPQPEPAVVQQEVTVVQSEPEAVQPEPTAVQLDPAATQLDPEPVQPELEVSQSAPVAVQSRSAEREGRTATEPGGLSECPPPTAAPPGDGGTPPGADPAAAETAGTRHRAEHQTQGISEPGHPILVLGAGQEVPFADDSGADT